MKAASVHAETSLRSTFPPLMPKRRNYGQKTLGVTMRRIYRHLSSRISPCLVGQLTYWWRWPRCFLRLHVLKSPSTQCGALGEILCKQWTSLVIADAASAELRAINQCNKKLGNFSWQIKWMQRDNVGCRYIPLLCGLTYKRHTAPPCQLCVCLAE